MSDGPSFDDIMAQIENAPYKWVIRPAGWHHWSISITKGLIGVYRTGDYGGWGCWGPRDRAVRKAERLVQRFEKEDRRDASKTLRS